MSKSDVGLIGLAVMGANLALNLENRGFLISVFNRTRAVTERFAAGHARGRRILPTYSLDSFVHSLARPRKIILMVKAGLATDTTINQLASLLDPGDIIVDGGNSLWKDTRRREKALLRKKSIHFIGCGISGGAEGALKGPALMPGGSPDSWKVISLILKRIAAVVGSEPCCLYMGPDGAGHYVKMVHNGIEYGDMQLICEAYAILKNVLGLSHSELHEVFSRWNNGELSSYLVGITAQILNTMDPDTGKPIVEVILDRAGQKGTGKWAIASAVDQGIATGILYAAMEVRVLSSSREERLVASQVLSAPPRRPFVGDRKSLINAVENALYASKIVNYAQGMNLLAKASKHYRWDLNFSDIVAVWRGGCIIRAQFLSHIKRAYENKPDLHNLMLDPFFCSALSKNQEGWRFATSVALQSGVPVPAFSAGLAYYDSYRSPNLSTSLIQAQRDFFGAHTYERVDKPGVFHTQW